MIELPAGASGVVRVGARDVALTNLDKPFFTAIGATKRDLLAYYVAVAPVLVPHLAGRPMVMKRYPHGADGAFFFMKNTPPGAPAWLERCAVPHGPEKTIAFPIVDDLAALLWVVNLGCIDLNPWYGRCDDVDRPDYLHFDLDPVKDDRGGTPFATVREAALVVHAALAEIGLPAYAKTSGSRGLHLYVPIRRGPFQHDVWRFAKAFAQAVEARRPDLLTAEYRIAKRPPGRVLVDYNQNAWGQTLASIYSVRPTPEASVSVPVDVAELERGIEIRDFTIATVPARVRERGDLFAPLVPGAEPRVDLGALIEPERKPRKRGGPAPT